MPSFPTATSLLYQHFVACCAVHACWTPHRHQPRPRPPHTHTHRPPVSIGISTEPSPRSVAITAFRSCCSLPGLRVEVDKGGGVGGWAGDVHAGRIARKASHMERPAAHGTALPASLMPGWVVCSKEAAAWCAAAGGGCACSQQPPVHTPNHTPTGTHRRTFRAPAAAR
jgi:hypothetical protein